MPIVTVVIPTYNRCSLLTQAINSVLTQSCSDLELLVIDDGSTDNTRQTVTTVNNPRIKYIYKANGGVSSARNLGLKNASGKFVAFLDHDDYYPENFLEVLIGELVKNPDYGMAYAPITVVTEEGKQIPFYKADFCKSGRVTQDLFKKGFIWTSSAVFRKSAWNGLWYDENLKKSTEDFDAYLRLSTTSPFLYVPKTTAYHRGLPDSLSNVKSITCSKPLVLERFYFSLGGNKYVSKKVAYKKISHSWQKVARQYYKAGHRKAAIKLLLRAVRFWPFDVRLYLRLAQAFLISKNSDKSPDWQMPLPLGSPVAADGKALEKSDKMIEDYYKNPRWIMLKFIPQNAKTTLEFGCGCGCFSELIKNNYNAECWGVEINTQAAGIASEKLYKVINADAHQALSRIPENYFDCIVFNDVLEHLADPYSLLTGIKTKLKSSGIVVASIPNVRFWNNLKSLIVYGRWDYGDSGILDKTHLRFFTYDSLVKMFRQLDYDVLTIEGLRPTRSTTFRIINALSFYRLKDVGFHQFACIVKPKSVNETASGIKI